MFIIIGFVMFIIAIRVATWRITCFFYEEQMPINTPLFWKTPYGDKLSFIIRWAASLCAAYLFMEATADMFSTFVGYIACGLTFALISIASSIFAGREMVKEKDYLTKK